MIERMLFHSNFPFRTEDCDSCIGCDAAMITVSYNPIQYTGCSATIILSLFSVVRNQGIGVCSTSARVGSITAPYIVMLVGYLPD